MNRRRFLPIAAAPLILAPRAASAKVTLPMSTAFKGESTFNSVLAKATRERWSRLPVGERMIKFARELRGRPYKGFTLEIHDHVESPSCNLHSLDCWCFCGCLGLA